MRNRKGKRYKEQKLKWLKLNYRRDENLKRGVNIGRNNVDKCFRFFKKIIGL